MENNMHINDLETPSVLIDLDIMECNIATMQARCNKLGVKFRAHIKTHKIPDIAKMQLAAGAVGIACQKVTEAQVFADAGITDIQIPYNIVGPQKTRRLAEMACKLHVTAMADHPLAVEGLAQSAKEAGIKLRVLADLRTSLNRTGASAEKVVELAKLIVANENLHFAGVLVYPSYAGERPAVLQVLAELERAGINVEEVSGGGLGGSLEAEQFPELTELRVGTYLFNDWKSVTKGWAIQANCAMTVSSTVISTPTPDRVLLDAGRKSISSDMIDNGHGHIVEYPEAHIYGLSEEHGHVDLSKCEKRPTIGERVHIIPVHTCVVTNLHNQIYGVRGDNVEITWPVAARGMLW
jgi:D-serine deaminase-like pyridoxal phosphate-dependent protein